MTEKRDRTPPLSHIVFDNAGEMDDNDLVLVLYDKRGRNSREGIKEEKCRKE